MSNLVVIAYPDINRAAQVMDEVKRMHDERLVDLEDGAYVTKDAQSRIQLHQNLNLTAAGAARGALWGTLIGMLFLVPVAGAAIGAGAGALAGKLSDAGINDAFMKELSQKMQPNSSAIFALVRRVTADKVIPEIAKYGGTVMQTSLSNDAEVRLQNALSQAAQESRPTA